MPIRAATAAIDQEPPGDKNDGGKRKGVAAKKVLKSTKLYAVAGAAAQD
jgi:hypothetical protein